MAFQQPEVRGRSRPRLVYQAPARLDRATAAHARQLFLALELPPATRAELVRVIDRDTRSEERWAFVMLSPQQNAEVVRWIFVNSKRPQKCAQLWAQLFVHMRNDTGEILASRADLAGEVGMLPRDLSSCMSELERVNAVQRRRDGRGVRYFMNPNVATRAAGAARDSAQAQAGPLLTMMEGGRLD